MRVENLEEKNPHSDSEINASDENITENNGDKNYYSGKDKAIKLKKKEEIIKTSKSLTDAKSFYCSNMEI